MSGQFEARCRGEVWRKRPHSWNMLITADDRVTDVESALGVGGSMRALVVVLGVLVGSLLLNSCGSVSVQPDAGSNTGSDACTAGSCTDPAFPFCDVDGSVSGNAGTCIAVSCTPAEVKACAGDKAVVCNAAGNNYEEVACALGCMTSPNPHCGYIEPQYVPDVCDTPAADDFIIGSTATFDPNLDPNCNGGVIPQNAAPSLCVVHHRKISIASAATLKVPGVQAQAGSRPVVFVADEELSIDGTLDVGAHGLLNGPGGGVVMSGGASSVTGTEHKAAGGAGGRYTGGAGGSSTADGGAANGGAATGDPALFSVLMGGASAGRSTSATITSGGGGGGGAVVLVSCRGAISVAGNINAGGGGGSPGQNVAILGGNIAGPGFGGGAGGYVVLQAQSISVTGGVFANGGGGGAGMRADRSTGAAGADGGTSAIAGGTGGVAQNGEGSGGNGGFSSNPAQGGKHPPTSPATAGGGGGSVGFLQTYTPTGVQPTITGAVSPSFMPNLTSKTR